MLNTPFRRGLALGLGLGLGDAITVGLADTLTLGAVDTLAEGPAVPPPQPEMARVTIPLTRTRFLAREGDLVDVNTAKVP